MATKTKKAAKRGRLAYDSGFAARLRAHPSVSPELKMADKELCSAGRLLQDAATMLTRTSCPSCLSREFEAYHTEARIAAKRALMLMAIARNRQVGHLDGFIDGIMRGGLKGKRAAKAQGR